MKQPKPTTIDFEGFGIEGRPAYPPMPVGVSIKPWGKKSKYYAFGHREGNNCCWSEAAEALREAYACKDGILFQNGKFDVDVGDVWFNLGVPSWDKIHDTMFLLFLDDPHQRELGLKEAAVRLLNQPPEEQDVVAEWLIKHQPVPGVKISKAKSSEHYFGRYLCLAPGKLAGKYAKGDTDRTAALFKLLWKKTVLRGMQEPYDRERRLMPVLLEMERQGVPVNLKQLRADVEEYSAWRGKLDLWVIKRLACDPGINLNSGQQLFKAMLAAEVVDEKLAPLTPTGKYQTNKEALLLAVADKQLLGVLKYRAQLNTCLGTFMSPWLKTAEVSNGYIYTSWNQVRAPKGASTGGARTGRLSSTPNFQNAPNAFKPIFKCDTTDRKLKRALPSSPFNGLPKLPKIRTYIIAPRGEVLIDRDYSQQEPRILAHFDDGKILEKYRANPWIDFHDSAKEELKKVGRIYDRKAVKAVNLGIIYGMGVGLMAEKNGLAVEETSTLKKSILQLYPGIKEMNAEMKRRARAEEPIRTWGGREYYCEPPKLVKGSIREFSYKLLNVLIQGSAADCTKEAMIRFHAAKPPTWRIILNVHDQIAVSVPKRDVKKAMEVLRVAMETVEFDVPMLSEGDTSSTNWGELNPYDVKGELV